MNPICFYHKADLDGVASGAIVKHFVPDCELYGYDYHEEFPWEKVKPGLQAPGIAIVDETPWRDPPENPFYKRTVYMVDVSLKPDDMKRLAEVSNLIFIDHHVLAVNAADPSWVGNRKVGTAACELCWEYFNDPVNVGDHRLPMPEAIRLLGTYDTWRKGDPEWESKILPFQYGARCQIGVYDPTSLVWQHWLGNEQYSYHEQKVPQVVQTGIMILRYQAEVNRRACETGAREFTLHFIEGMWQSPREIGFYFARYELPEDPEERARFLAQPPNITGIPKLRVLACNTIVFNSQFFDGFYDPTKHDVMCAYAQLKDGRWKVSLYSTKPEIDCSAICKAFGGGGHKGAAGFDCDKLPWENPV